jgi:HK97 gp10 family phage protein
MRVENWHAKGIFNDVRDAALLAVNNIMDDVVEDAKHLCPVGTVTRPDSYVNIPVSFTPTKGKNKGKLTQFVAKTWMGRQPGSLKNTIRKVEGYHRPGNIRAYAGTQKVFYARFVEYGTSRTSAKPFMRPSFLTAKPTINSRIESEIRTVPEVK